MRRGRLVYVMGPSGSGKDSLLAESRRQLPAGAPVAFAHRYITRPRDAGGENHVETAPAAFALLLQRGLFGLHWESHGLLYGLGREIDLWMDAGLAVVANGSRAALATALRRYPDLVPVLVTVPEDILRQRLLARGREAGEDLEERLARAALQVPEVPGLVRLENSGELRAAAGKLAALLLALGVETVSSPETAADAAEESRHAQ